MEFMNRLKAEAVVIPAEFINTYMASANGDFVKVYLCLLQNGSADIEEIAEKLMLTEGDVKRAIRYWQEKSVLGGRTAISARKSSAPAKALPDVEKCLPVIEKYLPAAAMSAGEPANLREKYRGIGCTEILNRLAEDPGFRELLLIVQTYLSKNLTEAETQVFAYLYDGLHLSTDVLDYLVAYSVEHDHANIHYIEKLGRDWAEVGVTDVKSAKRRIRQFEECCGSRKGTKTAAKAAAEPREGAPRTDYNKLVMQELLQNMGDGCR